MLCVLSSGRLSSKAGTISCYLLSLVPEAAKSKIAALTQYPSIQKFLFVNHFDSRPGDSLWRPRFQCFYAFIPA
jgi:hypothetical protein